MANKLTRIEIDSGMKEFIPKTGFTGDDLKQIGKKRKLKHSITIRRQKLKDNHVYKMKKSYLNHHQLYSVG